MTTMWAAIGADVFSVMVLAYVVYYRRYFRRDLVLAYVALNVGVLTVTTLLSTSSAGMGLGLGLFGILSIIRLRSSSITQEEVAYYFVSLALGLVAGLHPDPVWLAPALCVLLVGIMYVADHPRFAARTYRQTVTVDVAHPDLESLKAALEELLGATVLHVVVQDLDMVRDLTVVDVRFRVNAQARQQTKAAVSAPREEMLAIVR